ncbi:hypothetical protein Q9Q99_05035 [Curtobacterium flaccumfaciens]|nr:hypothetical protein Q9Q99_05035 [Curtobacterium flaccumfaciens]
MKKGLRQDFRCARTCGAHRLRGAAPPAQGRLRCAERSTDGADRAQPAGGDRHRARVRGRHARHAAPVHAVLHGGRGVPAGRRRLRADERDALRRPRRPADPERRRRDRGGAGGVPVRAGPGAVHAARRHRPDQRLAPGRGRPRPAEAPGRQRRP